MTLLESQQTPSGHHEEESADSDRYNSFAWLVAEKINAYEEEQDRQPEGP